MYMFVYQEKKREITSVTVLYFNFPHL